MAGQVAMQARGAKVHKERKLAKEVGATSKSGAPSVSNNAANRSIAISSRAANKVGSKATPKVVSRGSA